MPDKALKQQLTELHAELASADDLDPALRRQLRDVADDIERLLAEETSSKEVSTIDQVQARIEEATVEFEAEYPRFARILEHLADTLAKLGI